MNQTQRTLGPIITQARACLAGVRAVAAIVGLKANDAETFARDFHLFAGRPADPMATPPVEAIVGKQPAYMESRVQHALARTQLKAAVAEGRRFCAQAVDTLKGIFGRRWNSQWAVVGFVSGSLELSREPVPMLILLEAYFRSHAEREVAALNLTAAYAMQVLSAIDAARSAAAEARDREGAAKQERDAAWKRLRKRIASLRNELSDLIEPDDSRWYRFGFRRPMDGQTPDLVPEVKVRPAGEGQAVVEWPRARLAENYRVAWKVAGSMEEPTPAGLFADRQAILTGLPRGTLITVIVSARNAAGESAPMSTEIALP